MKVGKTNELDENRPQDETRSRGEDKGKGSFVPETWIGFSLRQIGHWEDDPIRIHLVCRRN